MLILPIKKKWYDMIKSGVKKEEYREIKPYWSSRVMKEFDDVRSPYLFDGIRPVIFRNGYRENSPQIKALCRVKVGEGKVEWRSTKR